ncbi:40S ribosomal protein S4 [Nephila pilipes]|uniref:40S ribosomal protein S4 n=1 Tax=Nephila pilipes TaxID=299642 RepID=A0A8X6MA45_NEPPI|nr:40S ribosomal protein S4 [Nephila pilipes]
MYSHTKASRPSTEPHILREFLPLVLIHRNRLKYARTKTEVTKIVMQRLIKIDVKYKLCRVKRVQVGPKGIPFRIMKARTIRYPDPLVKVNDSIQVDIASGKIMDFVKFEVGNLVMITGGHNLGRIGNITSRERHPGSFDIVHVKDSLGHSFATSKIYAEKLTFIRIWRIPKEFEHFNFIKKDAGHNFLIGLSVSNVIEGRILCPRICLGSKFCSFLENYFVS